MRKQKHFGIKILTNDDFDAAFTKRQMNSRHRNMEKQYFSFKIYFKDTEMLCSTKGKR